MVFLHYELGMVHISVNMLPPVLPSRDAGGIYYTRFSAKLNNSDFSESSFFLKLEVESPVSVAGSGGFFLAPKSIDFLRFLQYSINTLYKSVRHNARMQKVQGTTIYDRSRSVDR